MQTADADDLFGTLRPRNGTTQVPRERVQYFASTRQANGQLLAGGQPNAAARVAVVAERPTEVPFAGLSVLPWAWATERVRTLLTVHNAGATVIGFRIVFLNTDGGVAGCSAPQRLDRHATASASLNELAGARNLGWTSGAVHVEWVGRGSSRVSTVS